MYDDRADTHQVMTQLRDLGIATVSIAFSGGNDEGGADSTDFLDAEGNTVEVPTSRAYSHRQWNGSGYGPETWEVHVLVDGKYTARPATADEIAAAKIRTVLEAPIYAKYHTFAGEFYVDGTLTWDVAAGTSKMHGRESYQEWDEF